MKVIYLIPLILFIAEIASANELVISYAPSATVKDYIYESDKNGSSYSRLSLDSGTGKGVRWIPRSKLYYIDFSVLESESGGQGENHRSYKSVSAGARFIQDFIINEDVNAYLGCTTGVGAAEFSTERNKIRPFAEASFKGGVVFKDTFTVGPEVKFQFVGTPGETAARVLLFNVNAGLRF
ncbi:hypothetical protein OQJ59_01560 [Microbulbifer thermotolerans]|uniref:Outer membrane protein beta-barrel domain-containing protein n=1 Tax=Microbulbifer thermotolerans TaxID=252514 RepID=A0AB35I0E4_MICTH|nr:hypothetical protein [Microbulbifer thermotolerans]MCX2802491.1 hypothetical protein [Microbulbifer thermotolerans]MCX2840300.1 hypothetical protein [Microbulbifer thermotolerans]